MDIDLNSLVGRVLLNGIKTKVLRGSNIEDILDSYVLISEDTKQSIRVLLGTG